MNGAFEPVLQVGASDRGGGAERVMMDLHAEYRHRGVDAWVAAGCTHGDDERVLQIPNEESRSAWTRSLGSVATRLAATGGALRTNVARALLFASDPLRYLAILAGREDMAHPGTRRILELPATFPSVLHLHNFHGGYFDFRVLPELTASVPALITMHDAWLLTGHCTHPFGCERWCDGCGECPALDTPIAVRRDATARNRALKRAVLEQARPALVTPSRWLMQMVEASGLADILLTRVIENGVDPKSFSPGDRMAARAELGLPADAEILLVSGNNLEANPYKDFGTFLKALPGIRGTDGAPLVVALGATADRPDSPILRVPFSDDPRKVAMYLRAADVYVHAARAENAPLSVIEALACGTPVVASSVGGVLEIVEDGVTGLLVPPGDAQALAGAVTRLLGDSALRERLAVAGPRVVAERFTLEKQADAYLDFYRELTEGRRRTSA